MPRDDDKSLGDEATLQGGKVQPADERSLGDRSTFGGGEGSSVSDLGEFADLPDHDMEIVDLSSRYKIEESLGKGGMGEVLLATDTRLDRKVAIKRIRGNASSSKTAVARFLTEAKSVAALSHNNVVQVYDYGRDQEGPFLIMEYVPGGSLLDRCKQGPIELEEAVDLACQLCDGLGRAHDAGIIHRDIKPANILLTDDNIPKLTDFGLAKAESRDHTMTMAGAVLGTLDFMPPEQRQDASLVDARSDLWSLTATLYQMVTGESPKVIRIKKVPAQLQDLIDKALEDAKDDRYQTALELKDALRQALQGGADADAELDQGECPHCGTKNDVSRKFCRNADCGGSLEVPCLSCTTGIPMWEAVCGSCGAKQELLIAKRREEMASQKTEAEACVANHKYDQAIRLMTSVEKVKDLRLQQLKGWADAFRGQVESERHRAVESAGKRLLEAKEHELAADYPAAIKSLEQVPESLRGRTLENQSVAVGAFLAQLRRKQQQIQNLEQQLRNRVKAKQFTGLLKEVESLLRLVPNHGNALKLKEQLLAREDKLKRLSEKAYAEAVSHFESQNYNETLSALSRIEESQVDSAVEELRDQTETVLNTLVSLNKNIKEKLASKEYSDLEDLVDHFLILKADDSEKKRLKEQLVERDGARKRSREEGFAEAQEQVKQHEYKAALASLGKIPRALADPQVRELRDQIKGTVAEIYQLNREIERLSGTGEATTLRRRLKEYLALQPNDGERQQLLAQLIEKEQKAQELADNALSRAQELVSQFQFENALTQLAAIPEARLTDESRALTGTCSKLKTLREKALHELQTSLRFHTYGKALEEARAYQSGAQVLPTHKDAEFHDLRKQCLKSQQTHEEESKRLAEKQALKKKLMMTASLAAILAIVAAGILWVNTMSQASDLAAALKEQRWNDAIAIDPGNPEALAGKTRVLLSSNPPDVSAALDLLNRIEAAQPGTDTVAPLKAQAFALRSQAYAKAGEIDKAESFLNDAVKLGVTEPAAGETRHAIGIAYIQQATDFLNSDSDDTYERAESSLQQAGALVGNSTALKTVQKLASARYLAKAESLLDEGMLAESGELISKAESHDTTSPLLGSVKTRYLKLDAEAKADRGDHSGSLASYEAAARISEQKFVTERARQHVEIGKLKLASEDAQAAIVHLKEAIRIDESLHAIADLAIPLTRLLVDQCESKNTDGFFQKAVSTAKSAMPYVTAEIDKREGFDTDFDRLCSLLMQSALVLESEITEATLQMASKRLVQYQSLNAVRRVEQSDTGLRVMQALATCFAEFEVTKTTTEKTKLLLEVWDLIYPMVVDKSIIEKDGTRLIDAYLQRLKSALKEENYQVASQLDQILRTLDTADTANPTEAWLEIPAHKWAAKAGKTTAAQLLADLQSTIGTQFTDSNYAQASVTYEVIGQLDKTAQQNFTDQWLSIPHTEVRELSDATRSRVTASVSALAVKSGDYQKALIWDPNNAEAVGMKVKSDLNAALKSGDYKTALRLAPNDPVANSMQRTAKRQLAILHSRPSTNSIGMKLKAIPAGKFTMGEGSQRRNVTLTQPFMIGVHEVTQKQFEFVRGLRPSKFEGEKHPVDNVSWSEASLFCEQLSDLPAERSAGREYRLPTEAEWEYACRAGTATAYSFGDDNSDLGDHAWYNANSDNRTHPLGGKQPNGWGLYDMHGNVCEWCQDWYIEFYEPAVDPAGPVTGTKRTLRGGNYGWNAEKCRSAVRNGGDPSNRYYNCGFRVVCFLRW